MRPRLNDQDIADIAEFLSTWGGSSAPPVPDADQAVEIVTFDDASDPDFDPDSTDLTFTGVLNACGACHGPFGNTPTVAGYPKLGGQYPSYLEYSMQAYLAKRRDDLIMQQQLEVLTMDDDMIKRLAEFYGSEQEMRDHMERLGVPGAEVEGLLDRHYASDNRLLQIR